LNELKTIGNFEVNILEFSGRKTTRYYVLSYQISGCIAVVEKKELCLWDIKILNQRFPTSNIQYPTANSQQPTAKWKV
jgi:hypothetical protein